MYWIGDLVMILQILLILFVVSVLFTCGVMAEMLAELKVLETKRITKVCFFFSIIGLIAIPYFLFNLSLFTISWIILAMLLSFFFIGALTNDYVVFNDTAKVSLIFCIISPICYLLGV